MTQRQGIVSSPVCFTVLLSLKSRAAGRCAARIRRPWKSEQPTNIPALLHSEGPDLNSAGVPTLLWQRSSDKRLRMQTGRSVQLQDASVGGPEEGCRALFIQWRCRGSAEMGIALKAFQRVRPRNDVTVEKRSHTKKHSLGYGGRF